MMEDMMRHHQGMMQRMDQMMGEAFSDPFFGGRPMGAPSNRNVAAAIAMAAEPTATAAAAAAPAAAA